MVIASNEVCSNVWHFYENEPGKERAICRLCSKTFSLLFPPLAESSLKKIYVNIIRVRVESHISICTWVLVKIQKDSDLKKMGFVLALIEKHNYQENFCTSLIYRLTARDKKG